MARRAHDAYFTPRWATAALLLHAPDLGGALYDPCCGDGRMALQLQEAGVVGELYLNDIDPAAGRLLGLLDRAEMTALDATRDEAWKAPAIDLVISNPPFMAAGSIARQALRHARVAVALLLRITWLEPCAGRTWLLECPPTEMIVLPRISFTGGGTDSATCAWFIWRRAHGRGTWQRGSIALAGREESAGQMPLQLPPREPWVGSDIDGERL